MGFETLVAQDVRRALCLALAGFDQKMPSRDQPLAGFGGDPAMEVESVRPAVESHSGLEIARFGGHRTDRVARHVGSVRHDDVDRSPKLPGQRRVEIPRVHVSAERLDVAQRTSRGGGIDVRRMKLQPTCRLRQRRAHSPGSTTDIEDDARVKWHNEIDQKLSSFTGHEDARLDDDAHTEELCPPEHLFQRSTGYASGEREFQALSGKSGNQQRGFVLCIDTACGSECAGNCSEIGNKGTFVVDGLFGARE